MGINDFKKGHQPRTNIIKKNEKDNLFTDCHNILASWRKHFFQVLNVHGVNDVRQREKHTGVNDVRQREKHTAEPLVPELSAFEI